MDASDLGDDLAAVLVDTESIQQRVRELAIQIDADYSGRFNIRGRNLHFPESGNHLVRPRWWSRGRRRHEHPQNLV